MRLGWILSVLNLAWFKFDPMKQYLFLMQPTNQLGKTDMVAAYPKCFLSKILSLGGSGVQNTSKFMWCPSLD